MSTITYPAPELVARHFCAILSEWLTPEELADVRRLNAAEHNPTICHTHDFCDANQAMLDAFTRAGLDCTDESETDFQAEEFLTVWHTAWSTAKQHGFAMLPHITKGEALEHAKRLYAEGYKLVKQGAWRAADFKKPVLASHFSAMLKISHGSASSIVHLINAWSMGRAAVGEFVNL